VQGLEIPGDHLYQNTKDGASANEAGLEATIAGVSTILQTLGEQQLQDSVKHYLDTLLK